MKNFLSLCAALLTTACSEAGFMAVNAPTYFSNVKTVKNIAFGAGETDRLDIYFPPETSKASPRPVIVFYHGGRWTEGTRGEYRFAGTKLAEKGYITVVPDYRKYPDVKFPAFVEDAAKSFAWVHDHIADYGGDPAKIFIAGHSSGAHVGSLIATDERYLKAYGKNSRQVLKGFAGVAGPYAFTPEDPDLIDMFGPPENYPNMRATSYIEGKEPPMYLLWGEDDKTVYAFNHQELAKEIKSKGGCVAVKTYPGLNHMWIMGAFSSLGNGKADVAGDIASYFADPVCEK